MKLIFIFLTLFGFHSPNFSQLANKEPSFDYQLVNNQIIKRMSEPIEVKNQADNLLRTNDYLTQTQLVLPHEDLEYMRSNHVLINLSFDFQFEWWNTNDYQTIERPQISQSLKNQDLIARPRQIISRLIWPSVYIRPDRPFAHAILFYYDQEFNLMMAHQLESDLVDWELNAIKQESHGAPQAYRIRLTNLQLNYPIPSLFFNLQTQWIDVPTFYARQNWEQWFLEFNSLFLNSHFFTTDNFDQYLVRPQGEDKTQLRWINLPNGENGYLELSFKYQNYSYLKIYQYFFAQPKLKIIYHQYLDLSLEFDQTTLNYEPSKNPWEIFQYQHQEWSWWLNNHVEIKLDDNFLILNSKHKVLVRGEAKIQLIKQKPVLTDEKWTTDFDYLQFENPNTRNQRVFKLFQKANFTLFEQEVFENYRIIAKNNQQFVLEALETANWTGQLDLHFKEIKLVTKISDLPDNQVMQKRSNWLSWIWILIGIIGTSLIILILLKFKKSKVR